MSDPVHNPVPARRGLCLRCNYPLEGLDRNACPECGRAFDPADPRTMNMGPPVGRVMRMLLRPTGWAMITLAIVATGAMVWVTGWPVEFAAMNGAELKRLFDFEAWISPNLPAGVARRTDGYTPTPTQLAVVASVTTWALILFFTGFRWLLRIVMLARYGHCFEQLKARRWRLLILPALATIMFVLTALGWVQRMGREWTGAHLRAWEAMPLDHPNRPWGPNPPDCPYPVSGDEQWLALTYVFDHARSLPLRAAALHLMNGSDEDRLFEFLVGAAKRERDPRVLAGCLLLVAMHRDASTHELFASHLDHQSPLVRSAAADALGILHRPLPALPEATTFVFPRYPPSIKAMPEPPPVNAYYMWQQRAGLPEDFNEYYDEVPVIELPGEYRDRLVAMVTNAETLQEREAAARALVGWPPKDYKLRVAEWGVWLVEGSDIKLVQSILDEVPPFVHRTGNSERMFLDRVIYPSTVTKPIIHITSDRLMAVDLEVQISQGRPWFAFPRPDQFNVETGTFQLHMAQPDYDDHDHFQSNDSNPGDRPMFIAPLMNAKVPPLDPIHEGYPWLVPGHRDVRGGAAWGTDPPDIVSLGLRWQSVIVSPKQLAWMTPPPVGSDPKFQWWQRLREVKSSYVSNRGEGDRFIYYDGPTRMKAMVEAHLTEHGLRLKARPMPTLTPQFPDILFHPTEPATPFPRAGLVIRTNGVRTHGWVVKVPESLKDDAREWEKIDDVLDEGTFHKLDEPELLGSDAVRAALRKMLTESGLNDDEAAGLIDCWSPQFFETKGTRLIVRMSSEDYAHLCPIRVSPTPTQMHRVGLTLHELE